MSDSGRRLRARFVGVGAIRGVALGSGLGLTLLLATSLGPSSFGIYATVVASSTAAAVLSNLGLGRLSLATVPKIDTAGADRHTDAGLVALSLRIVAITGPLAGMATGGITLWAGSSTALAAFVGLMTASLAVATYLSSAARAVGAEWRADATEGLQGGAAGQGISLAVLLLLDQVGWDLTVTLAVAVHTAVLVGLAGGLATTIAARAGRRVGDPVGLRSALRRAAPYALTQASTTVPVDLWIVAITLGPADLGLYGLARKIAMLGSVPLQIANQAAIRDISRLLGGERAAAQATIRHTARLSLLFAGPPLVALWLAASALVEFAFGAGYDGATPILLALSLGVAANVVSGPCALVLSMGNRAGAVARTAAVRLFVLFPLGVVMAAGLGPVGVGYAVSITTAAQFLALAAVAYRSLGIWTPAVGPAWPVARLRFKL